MTLPTTVTASVATPVTGDQTLNNINADVYYGTSGDFSSGNLVLNSGAWNLTVFDNGQPYTYSQKTPDAAKPNNGDYDEVGSGTGTATVL